jgi:hypothetical protein
MPKYNGHRNWNHWNVSLWIANDESLYNMARGYIRRAKTRDHAAAQMLADLNDCGIVKTPDGARYSKTSIRHAMRGM